MYILSVIHVSKEQKACHQEFVMESKDIVEEITNRFKPSTYVFMLKKVGKRKIAVKYKGEEEERTIEEGSMVRLDFETEWLSLAKKHLNKEIEWAHMLDENEQLLDCLPKSKF